MFKIERIFRYSGFKATSGAGARALFLFVLMAIASNHASATITASAKLGLNKKNLEENFRSSIENSLAAATAEVTLETACSALGSLALLDPDLTSKISLYAADGTCFLVAVAFGFLSESNNTVMQITESTNDNTDILFDVATVETSKPYRYSDGLLTVTSTRLGNDYFVRRKAVHTDDIYIIQPESGHYDDAKTLADHDPHNIKNEKTALSELKTYMQGEDERKSLGACDDSNPESASEQQRRQLALLQPNNPIYCLRQLPHWARQWMPATFGLTHNVPADTSTIQFGVDAVTHFHQPGHIIVNTTDIFNGSGLVNLDNDVSRVHLQRAGLLHNGRDFILPGNYLAYDVVYRLINLSNIWELSLEEWVAYARIQGLTQTFTNEVDYLIDADLENALQMNGQPQDLSRAASIFRSLIFLALHASLQPSITGENLGVIIGHRITHLDLANPQAPMLTALELLILCAVVELIETLPQDSHPWQAIFDLSLALDSLDARTPNNLQIVGAPYGQHADQLLRYAKERLNSVIQEWGFAD